MSTTPKPDGGPAFPCAWLDFQPHTGEQVVREQFFGATLRDYFAAKAMAAYVSTTQMYPDANIAILSYRLADAMIAERNKTP